jgi:hypothetical protein
MKIYAFGDSFVVGDQDDFYGDPNTSKTNPPTHGMSYNQRLEYLKYNVSFVSLIAKHLNVVLINRAERGSGNYPQIDKLKLALASGEIVSGDIVLFGITSLLRDRITLHQFEKITDGSSGPSLIDRNLINDWNIDKISKIDLFYLLAILEKLSTAYNVKIIKFNLFTNTLAGESAETKQIYKSVDSICLTEEGNTLIDILNDTWGQATSYPYHDKLIVSPGYEYLYTNIKHPSIEGHKKIATWWINNIINENSIIKWV